MYANLSSGFSTNQGGDPGPAWPLEARRILSPRRRASTFAPLSCNHRVAAPRPPFGSGRHDAWLTMPPEPYEYQGRGAIGVFLRGREVSRGRLRLVPTRANGQPAFACYLPSAQADIARPYALFVLALQGNQICAITWFADSSAFPQFGLPRMLR